MAKNDTKPVVEEVASEEVAAPTLRKYREKVKARYPDFNPEKEEDWLEMEDKYAEEVEMDLGKYKEAENKLIEAMKADTQFAQVVLDVAVNSMPLRAAIAKSLSEEDLIPKEGDDDYEAFQTARAENLRKATEMSELEKKIAENQEATLANIDKFAEENGYTEEQKNALIDLINETYDKLMMKDISPELLLSFHKMMNFDSEVQAAQEAGQIEGRNAAIEIKKATDTKDKKGDGVPVPASSSVTDREKKKTNAMFEGVGRRRTI